MSEKSRRRRLVGRALVGAGALALPLTASISYASASAQVPDPIAPMSPLSPLAPLPAAVPLPPEAPEVPEVGEPTVRQFAMQREGQASPQTPQTPQTPQARAFAPGRGVPRPMPAPVPSFEFDAWGDPHGPEFEAEMERFEREMEQWSRQMEDWGEKWGEQYAAQAEAQALAFAEAGRNMPEVIESCDPSEQRRTTTADGRPRVVICERDIRARAHAGALAGLRGARASIAHNGQISDSIQREILADLDEEIERIERGED